MTIDLAEMGRHGRVNKNACWVDHLSDNFMSSQPIGKLSDLISANGHSPLLDGVIDKKLSILFNIRISIKHDKIESKELHGKL